jgi:hypothetical protein
LGRLIAYDGATEDIYYTNPLSYIETTMQGGTEIAEIYEAYWEVGQQPVELGTYSAVIVNQVGSGRVVYFAGQLDVMHQSRANSALALRMWENAVDWVTLGQDVVHVNSPEHVYLNLTTSNDGDNRALHLLNCNSKMNEQGAFRIAKVSQIRDLLVTVQNPAGKAPLDLKMMTTGQSLGFSNNGDSITFSVPVVDEFESVLIEYQ